MAASDHSHGPALGVRNLVFGCAGLAPGDEILIVGENNEAPHFDPEVCRIVEAQARRLSLRPRLCLVDAGAPGIPAHVLDHMQDVAATFFFSRLGGRARFDAPDVPGRVVNCYATDPSHLGDAFCTLDYALQRVIHDALVDQITQATRYTITAPCGTELSGHVPASRAKAVTEFALDIFPIMIFPPVMCDDLAGKLVLDHFITSSATRLYEDSILMLDRPLVATLEGGRVTHIDGPAEPAARLRAQMERAAALTGGDPMRVNSWHTGINPNTNTDRIARQDPERWSAIAFGAPRYTHFHASGHDPGDVAFSLLDATIRFDDEPFWQGGRFVFLDRPEVQRLIPPEQRGLLASGVTRPIGI